MKRLVPLLLALGLIAANIVGVATGQDNNKWRIKVTNLTETQPFTPPMWAVHSDDVDLWEEGEQATNGHMQIAEDALGMPLVQLLNTQDGVRMAGVGLPPETEPPTPPPLPPGMSREFTVETGGDEDRLSMLWMLVRTNDGFSGLDSYKLEGSDDQTIMVDTYDAGTEKNNEREEFVPGPPFGNFFERDPDAQLIAPHPGIANPPDGDLGDFAWTDPVARIEITKE